MKKLFTLFLLGCAATSLHAQYQVQNAGFEEWETKSYSSREGEEPVHWNSFLTGSGKWKSVAGYNQLEKMEDPRPGSTGQYSAKLFARKALGSIYAQGNLTTGCINMGSTTASDANGNYNYTNSDNSDFNQPFTGLPDAMNVWVKFNNTKSGHPYAKVNTILHTAGYYQDPYGNESSITATVVAKAENLTITDTGGEWQELTIPFVYEEGVDERPAYALVSFASNANPGQGAANEYLIVDDLEYLYYSELASLTFDGTDYFVEGQTAYDLSSVVYDASKLTCTSNGRAATIGQRYKESTGVLTITVKGDNWSEDNTNQHVYTVQFKVYTGEISGIAYNGTAIEGFVQSSNHYYTVMGEYTEGCLTAAAVDEGVTPTIKYDATTRIATISVPESGKDINYYVKFAKEATNYESKLVISMMGTFLSAPLQDVGITAKTAENTVDLQLRNFMFSGMNMGDIFVHDVNIAEDGTLYKEDAIYIFGETGVSLGQLPITLNGKLVNGELNATLGITWVDGGNMPITVDVYTPSTTSIDLTAISDIAEENISEVKTGLTNPNCIIYAASDAVAGSETNVVVGNSCASLVLDATADIEIPTAFTATAITLKRTFGAGWNTVCLPFATTANALGATEARAFTEVVSDLSSFTKVETMEANTPYLIQFASTTDASSASLSGDVAATAAATVTYGNVSFTGNYTAGKDMAGLYTVSGVATDGLGSLVAGAAGSTIGSTEAYFEAESLAISVNDYLRAVTSGNYGTICLPYAVEAANVSGAEFFRVAGKRTNAESVVTSVVLEPVADLEAGVPYIFRANADLLCVANYTGAATSTAANANGLVGTFTDIEALESTYYIIYNNKVSLVGEGRASLPANRAYIDFSTMGEYSGELQSNSVVINMDGTTDVAGITSATDATVDVYTIGGVLVRSGVAASEATNGLAKGLYIVNGKKVVVK